MAIVELDSAGGDPFDDTVYMPGEGIQGAVIPDHDWLIVREPDAYLKHDIATPAIAPLERITDTDIGAITIISQETSLVPYGVEDLIALLATTNPKKLSKLESHTNNRLVGIPGNDSTILRWNTNSPVSPIPSDYNKLVAHVQKFETEIVRLKSLGMRILNRNVFIVENDVHNQGKPTIYAAVERYGDGEQLSPIHESIEAKGPYSGNPEMHLALCNKVAAYLIGTPEGAPYINDNIVAPHQYAPDGTLYDYDVYVRENQISKTSQLQMVDYWLSRLPESIEGNRLRAMIMDVPWFNY